MAKPIRRILDRFWFTLDHEGVAHFQIVFYLILMFSGIYNLAFSESRPLTMVDIGGLNYQLWCWFNILGPLYCLLGKSVKSTSLSYAGLLGQVIGDCVTNIAVAAYVFATFTTEFWGNGNYGGFLGVATWISTIFLILRDMRRLRQVERLAKITLRQSSRVDSPSSEDDDES